jgi:signal transduction histidine kinase
MSTTPQQPPSGEKLILIVDDTPLNIGVISGALKDCYKTKVATNGQKALALASAEEKPDLILLDVRMPEMDGYEVCSRLKTDPATREIPVIFLTGQTGAEEEARGFEVGGVDYVHKPFSPAVVKARVQTHLQLREAHETIARQLFAKDSELEMTRADQFRDKLSALGKLSAGLAHELNNPASAAQRAAERLRGYMRELRKINLALSNQVSSCEQLSLLASFEENLLNRASSPPVLDALEQSDLEQEMEAWLSRHDVANAARLASGLIEAGVDRTALDELGEGLQSGVLSHALSRAVLAAAAERLSREIETSTGRISELVRAVKEYTYMDRAPGQEVDIHHGIESTLTILKFRLARGVQVKRDFDRNLPRVFAHGSELNQVWTNLVDNAIDAMDGRGELTIRTFRELDCVVVEIVDNGPGIPDHVKPRIFEPFFTTKGVGQGMGVGLATVYRIVNSHRGNVSFDSRPGRTSFQVRLPIKPVLRQ